MAEHARLQRAARHLDAMFSSAFNTSGRLASVGGRGGGSVKLEGSKVDHRVLNFVEFDFSTDYVSSLQLDNVSNSTSAGQVLTAENCGHFAGSISPDADRAVELATAKPLSPMIPVSPGHKLVLSLDVWTERGAQKKNVLAVELGVPSKLTAWAPLTSAPKDTNSAVFVLRTSTPPNVKSSDVSGSGAGGEYVLIFRVLNVESKGLCIVAVFIFPPL